MLSSDELKTLRQEGVPDDFILESLRERDPTSGAELGKLIEEGIPANFILDELSSRMAPAKQPTAEEAQRESRLSTFNKKGILAKLGGALQYGTAEAAAGYGKTGELVGSPTVTGIAGTVERAARPNDYVPASEGWNHPTKDDTTIFGKGVGYIPRMAAESLPGLGVDLLAASATGGLGALATYGARRIGQNVEQVAQNNNRDLQHATAGDIAQGGLATGVETAMNTLGMRGMGGTATRSVADLTKQVGKSALLEGGTEAAQEVATQAMTSAGTQHGLDVNLGDAAASGLAGGLAGAGVRTAHSAKDVTASVKFRDIDPQRATNLREYLGGLGVEPDSTKSALDLLKLGDKQLDAQIGHERQALQPMLKMLDERAPGVGRDIGLKIDEALNGIAHGSDNVDGLITELRDTLGTTRQGQSLVQALENKDTLYRLRQTGQESGDEFKGGIARHIENLSPFGKIGGIAAAGLGGSSVIPGMAGVGSLGAIGASLSTAGSAAAAGLGVYGATRAIDRVTGARNPVQTFMDASRGTASPSPEGADLEALLRQRALDGQLSATEAQAANAPAPQPDGPSESDWRKHAALRQRALADQEARNSAFDQAEAQVAKTAPRVETFNGTPEEYIAAQQPPPNDLSGLEGWMIHAPTNAVRGSVEADVDLKRRAEQLTKKAKAAERAKAMENRAQDPATQESFRDFRTKQRIKASSEREESVAKAKEASTLARAIQKATPAPEGVERKAKEALRKESGTTSTPKAETAASESPRAPSGDTVNYRGVDITIPGSVRERDRYLAGAKAKQDQIAGHIEEAMNSGVSEETSSFLAKHEKLLRAVRNRKDAKAALERVLAKAPEEDRATLEAHFGEDYLAIWSKENDGQ
jgi:hypothetical protein